MERLNYIIQKTPKKINTADNKLILEHFGFLSNNNKDLSLAHMKAPIGWSEPFQQPEFDEYTFIIRGKKKIIIDGDSIILEKGDSIKINKGSMVQYSNPFDEECEYLSICKPAFSIDTVNRDKQ